jgi:hypothetical protein
LNQVIGGRVSFGAEVDRRLLLDDLCGGTSEFWGLDSDDEDLKLMFVQEFLSEKKADSPEVGAPRAALYVLLGFLGWVGGLVVELNGLLQVFPALVSLAGIALLVDGGYHLLVRSLLGMGHHPDELPPGMLRWTRPWMILMLVFTSMALEASLPAWLRIWLGLSALLLWIGLWIFVRTRKPRSL